MTLDEEMMAHAAAVGREARHTARPNPWVGAVVVDERGMVLASGATEPPGEVDRCHAPRRDLVEDLRG